MNNQKTVVTLNVELGQGHPLSSNLIAEINAACDRAEDIGNSAVLHIKMTVHEMAEPAPVDATNTRLINQWERALRRVERLRAVTVAEMTTAARGEALSLMLTTDYRIIAKGEMLSLTDHYGKVMPGVALYRLAQQIGAAKARRLVLFGTSIDADTAQTLGIVDEVSEDSGSSVINFVEFLNPELMTDVSVRRRLLLEAASTAYDDALGLHLAACDRSLRTVSA